MIISNKVVGYGLVICTAIVIVRYAHQKLNPPRITRRGLPLRNPPGTLPIAGNGLKFLLPRQTLFDWFMECTNLYGHETLQISVPTLPPGVIISDPKNLDFVFKNHEIFQKGAFFKGRIHDLFGDGILNADGELWKRQRKVGTHFLSTSNLKLIEHEVLPKLLEQQQLYLQSMASRGEAVDLEAVIQEITTQLMGRLVYGIEMHSKDDFAQAFEVASTEITKRFQNPLWSISEYFFGSRLRRYIDLLKTSSSRFVSMALSAHKSQPHSSPKEENLQNISKSFINALFESLGDDKLVADSALNFLSAGRDTIAQALTWTMYLLIKHPQVLGRVRRYVQQARNERNFNQSTTSYIISIFYEAVRLYPPIPVQIRQVQEDAILPDGTVLPQNSIIVWCVWAMSRSKETWGSDALEFRPERWLVNGQLQQRTAGEFPYFQGGARLCIGKNLAEKLAVNVVSMIARRYDLDPAFEGEKESRTHLTMPMDGGLPVYLRECLVHMPA